MGRGVRGGSLINGMCWTRGGRADYDAWVALGNEGWGWDDLLPYFQKSENYTNNVDVHHRQELHISPGPKTHGTAGNIKVSYPRYFYNQSRLFLEALEELGIPTLSDPNNGMTTGARLGYYDGFIDNRPNFHIVTGQHVVRLLTKPSPETGHLDTHTGVVIEGVEFVSEGIRVVRNVTCQREVILAAGNAHTPQILELSGIGPLEVLAKFGIPVVIDLPGVGNNFQDQPYVGVVYYYNNASYFNINKMYYDAELYDELSRQYYVNKTGPWTSGAINTVAFPSLRSISENWTEMVFDAANQLAAHHLLPDLHPTILQGYEAQKRILVEFLRSEEVSAYEILSNNIGLMSVAVMHSFSRGSIHIQSRNPFTQPLIDPRYCSNPLDCQMLVEALLFNNKIVNTSALRLLAPTPYYPFLPEATPETLLPAILSGLRTKWSGVGATSMMPLEYGGVVDTRLKVYGTKNLRIVDAGIMPLVPASHLQAPVYAVAEKAADIIKADRAAMKLPGRATKSAIPVPAFVPFISKSKSSNSTIQSPTTSSQTLSTPSTFAELLNLSSFGFQGINKNPPASLSPPKTPEPLSAARANAVNVAASILFGQKTGTPSAAIEIKVMTVVPIPLSSPSGTAAFSPTSSTPPAGEGEEIAAGDITSGVTSPP